MDEPSSDRVLTWVERIAAYLNEQDGVPMIAGRVVGWLMICDPPEQTAGQLAIAIGASRASLTTSLRQLRTIGLVRRSTRPADPSAYYSVESDAWFTMVRKQLASLEELGRIARDGVELVGPDSDRAARARSAHDVSVWLAEAFGRTLDQHANPSARPGTESSTGDGELTPSRDGAE